MGFAELLAIAVAGLRTVLANPLLGGDSSVKMQEASELLGMLSDIITQGDDALDELREFTATITAMAEEGRDPTPAEWQALRERSDAAHDRLQAMKEEILREEGEASGEENPETPQPPTPPEAPTSEEGGQGEQE